MAEKKYDLKLKAIMLDGVMTDPETQVLSDHVNNANIHVTSAEKNAIASVSNLSELIEAAGSNISSINEAVAAEAALREEADNALTVSINGKVATDTFNAKVTELEAADTALQTAIDGKVAKNGTDRLMTALEGSKLAAYPEYNTLEATISAKAESADINVALANVYTKADAETMVDNKIAAAVTSIWSLKGQVDDMAALEVIAEPAVGDVYHVVTGEHGSSAEYFWNGTAWEEVGTVVDLNGYATKEYADGSVAVETSRATAAEAANASAIAAETSNRTAAVSAVDGKVDTEIERATAIEAALDQKINANAASITVLNSGNEVEGSVAYAVKAEADRAKAAEQTITAAITTEANTARSAEQTNAAAIAAEVTARAEAIIAVESSISTEATRAQGVEATLSEKVENLETSVAGKLDTETFNTSIATKADAATVTADINQVTSQVNTKTATIDGNVLVLINRLNDLEIQLDALKKTDIVESVTIPAADTTKDLVVTVEEPVTAPASVTGKSVTINQVTLVASTAPTTMLAVKSVNGDAVLKNIDLSGSMKTSTVQISVDANEYVRITDSVITASGYDGINIGTFVYPKSVLIDNVKFLGTYSMNVISFYGMQDNAVATISNCVFANCSNPIRIFNTTNTKLTLNLINCEFTQWESGTAAYTGAIICEDYIVERDYKAELKALDSSNTKIDTPEEIAEGTAREQAANRFSPDKITINMINCTHNGQPITFENLADVAGTKSFDTQLIYVYNHIEKFVEFDPDRYPNFTAK